MRRISVNEAEELARVSQNTLLRFADAGYFSIEPDQNGAPTFLLEELCSLFNIPAPKINPEVKDSSSSLTTTKIETAPLDSVGRSDADYVSPVVKNLNKKKETPLESEFEPDNSTEELVAATAMLDPIHVNTDFESYHEETITSDPIKEDVPETTQVEFLSYPVNADEKQLHADIQRLQRVIDLQDQLLDLREAELADLKEQRGWLQKRIEKLEDKADRDQLLLLTETQMISKMLLHQTQKKSPVILALEWLGFKKPEPATTTTIDYKYSNREKSSDQQKAA